MSMRLILLVIFIPLVNACSFNAGVSGEILKAQSYVDKLDYKQALKAYKKISKKDLPKNIEYKIYYQMAEIYNIYLQDLKSALIYYEKVGDNYKNEKIKKIALYKAAEISFFLKNYQKSIYFYTKLSEKKYLFEIALSYYEMNNWKKAEEKFKELKTTKSYFYLALIAEHRGKNEIAIDLFKKSILANGSKNDKVQSKFYLANLYERNMDLEKAYQYYYSILDTYPNPEIIKNRLNKIYMRKAARRR